MADGKPTIYMRADGDSNTGLGHLYRCLALSEILSSSGEIRFIIRKSSEPYRSLLRELGDNITVLSDDPYLSEAGKVSEMLKPADYIILDGYNFDTSYQEIINRSGAKTICVDDIYRYRFLSDVVINHAGGIAPGAYDVKQGAKLCLGPSYAIVRSEFWNKPSLENRKDGNVFISLGGADPKNDLIKILNSCLTASKYSTFHVVTGNAYRFEDELRELIGLHPSVHHYKNLDAAGMKKLMQLCPVAVCSASTVCYEYLSIGGELYLCAIAENQQSIYKYFTSSGLAFAFDRFGGTHPKDISRMLDLQNEVFDGKSQERLKAAILDE